MTPGIVSYFDPYDGYGYIVPKGKSSSETLTFKYDVIVSSDLMVQAVEPNQPVEFEVDPNAPHTVTKVTPVATTGPPTKSPATKPTAAKKAPAKKAPAAKKSTRGRGR